MNEVLQQVGHPKRIPPTRPLYIRTYRQRESIIEEGLDTPCFFVVLSGRVWIMQNEKKIRLLEEQDIFGLETIVFKKPSFYTVKAAAKARVAAYGPEAYEHFLSHNSRMTQNIISSILGQLLKTSQTLLIRSETFDLDMDEVEVRFLQEGEVIIEEGSKGRDFFKLVSTQAGLRVTIGGREINRVEKPGEFFGEMASFMNLPHQATVTSIGESVVQVYGAGKLDMIVRECPDIALQLIRTLISRLEDLSL